MTRSAWTLSVLAAFALGGCGGDFLLDTYFDEWCGDLPCRWTLDEGEVQKVKTWHREDYGAELVATPTQLSQISTDTRFECQEIDVISRSDADAGLSLLLDFDADGHMDFEQALSGKGFRRETLFVRAPRGFESVRYVLRKSGPGRAIIAKLSARPGSMCGEPIKLGGGATCAVDAACASGRCHDGHCSGCALGTCMDGELCREDDDCASGGCAGGVCRACAALGSCAPRESCSLGAQCEKGSCVGGALPALTTRPSHDGVCAECSSDADCPSGRCTLGFCGECTRDSDCGSGLVCRYADPYEASARACLPPLAVKRSRGQLCEADDDCARPLSCAAAPGRAKRCGGSCALDGDCGGGVCAMPGERPLPGSAVHVKLPSFEAELAARISTCFPATGPNQLCSVHAQCELFGMSCCDGACSDLRVDRASGMCTAERRHAGF